MRYPTLIEMPTSREMVDEFRGYNHNLRIGDGEFYEMTNLTSDNYPVLSPRPRRGTRSLILGEYILAMAAKDSLCYLGANSIVINEHKSVDLRSFGFDPNLKPKTLISMGAYLIIMPDKIYINTEDTNDCGRIEAEKESVGSVSFHLCTADGEGYSKTIIHSTPPTITDKMLSGDETIPMWIDTSSTPHSLKQYSTSASMWSSVATTYIKISSPGIGVPFSVNDGVTISGITDESLSDLNGSHVIWAKGDNYIVVKGMLSKIYSQTDPITVERRMPNMDFVIESGNRLWGCRYGVARNGAIVNEIYASKLGDFKNWNCFMGIATDSYVASVGTDGQFTGAISYLGYPIFFKETCMHKVYGMYPAQYQIQTTTCRGVQKGSSKSLAIVNEALYYKSPTGICVYDGSLPVEISSALGDKTYDNAVAGTLGNKYYVSMRDPSEGYFGTDHLFVYDTYKGMWHREDDTRVVEFCNCRGNLYYIEGAWIYAILGDKLDEGSGSVENSSISWEAITGVIGTDSPDKKYVSRMDVRMKLDIGTRVIFLAEYDSSGVWEYLFAMTGKNLQSFAIPIKPQRCDHFRLKIQGTGDAKIYSICKTIEQGSDV